MSARLAAGALLDYAHSTRNSISDLRLAENRDSWCLDPRRCGCGWSVGLFSIAFSSKNVGRVPHGFSGASHRLIHAFTQTRCAAGPCPLVRDLSHLTLVSGFIGRDGNARILVAMTPGHQPQCNGNPAFERLAVALDGCFAERGRDRPRRFASTLKDARSPICGRLS